MYRRREGLGRNRRGPAVRDNMGTVIVACVAMIFAGLYALDFFTQPQRIYGAKILKCSQLEIRWSEVGVDTYHIHGCDKQVNARCVEGRCEEIY